MFQKCDCRSHGCIGATLMILLVLLLMGCKQIVNELVVISLAGLHCSRAVGQSIRCVASRRILVLLLLLGLAIKSSLLCL